jgi:AAA domain
VILSSVRTKQPGFLKSQPRMNVALTRCRKGMVVVTDKSFLQGAGRSTLLGQLCRTWSRHHDACWIDRNAMLNNSGALPGLPAPAPSRPNGMMRSNNLSWRTTMPPRTGNPPPSQTQARTQARTHQDQVSPLARATLSPRTEYWRRTPATTAASMEAAHLILSQWRLGRSGGGAQSAQATVVRRDFDADEFPSLQPLATALDPTRSSRQSSWRSRR